MKPNARKQNLGKEKRGGNPQWKVTGELCKKLVKRQFPAISGGEPGKKKKKNPDKGTLWKQNLGKGERNLLQPEKRWKLN